MPEPHLRAADTDREAVAAVLGRHMADGRLTVAEYDERLTKAYAARTYGELGELTADLPATKAPRPPAPRPARAGGCTPSRGPHEDDLAQGWQAWAGTSAIVLTIWLLTGLFGDFGYFWPMWVIGPWGAVLTMSTLAQSAAPGRSRRVGT